MMYIFCTYVSFVLLLKKHFSDCIHSRFGSSAGSLVVPSWREHLKDYGGHIKSIKKTWPGH